MKQIILAFLIILSGCREKVAIISPQRIDTINFASAKHAFGSVYVQTDTLSTRYFYITYSTTSTDRNTQDYGWVSMRYDGFPSKNYVDSSIYEFLPNSKKCYQRIIIENIMEFKNASDYHNFLDSYHGSKQFKHKQQNCN